MTTTPATTYVNACCQCELNAFRVAFDTASLPVMIDFCHCSTCRHLSGQMAMQHVPIKGVPLERTHSGLSVHSSRSQSRTPSRMGSHSGDEDGNGKKIITHHGNVASTKDGKLAPPSIQVEEAETAYDLGDLTAYRSSDKATRYFCKSCSAYLFFASEKGEGWFVTVGVLEKFEGVFSRPCHQFVLDTLDGGLADHLRVVDGVRLPRHGGAVGSEEVPFPWSSDALDKRVDGSGRVKGYCHCGTISFEITRPSEASFAPSAAYPDLIHQHEGSRLSTINNTKDEKWWLYPPSNPTKYLAGHCMCTFCRLATGATIASWAFIPLANIVKAGSDTPLDLSNDTQRPRGLKQYISSPGEYCEFCATCGATVFSWQAGTPDLIHVAVGVLDETREGARLEGWLEWHRGRVGYQEKGFNEAYVRGLLEGLTQ